MSKSSAVGRRCPRAGTTEAGGFGVPETMSESVSRTLQSFGPTEEATDEQTDDDCDCDCEELDSDTLPCWSCFKGGDDR